MLAGRFGGVCVCGGAYSVHPIHSCSEVCLEKHLVCEPCGPNVAGGYDPANQQVHIYIYIVIVIVSIVMKPLYHIPSDSSLRE